MNISERPPIFESCLDIDKMTKEYLSDEQFRNNQHWLLPNGILTPIKINPWKKYRKKLKNFIEHLKKIIREDIILD